MPARAPDPSKLGHRLGPRIAEIVTKAQIEHLHKSQFIRSRIGAEGANEFFKGMSKEKWQHVTPMWQNFLGGETTPPELEAVLQFIAHGTGEVSEVLNAIGMGNAVGTSILAAVQNYLAPLNQGLIAAAPYSVLEPGIIATAVAAKIPSLVEPYGEAARSGIDASRFNVLKELAEQFPGLSELIELWRRGQVDEAEVIGALERQGMRADWTRHLVTLKREHLTPADAALGTLRGIITDAEGASIAAISGLTKADFETLVGNTGEPPGLMQMLEGFRRGFINSDELHKGIRQSRVRNEWIPLVEKLRFAPASAADAINGVVQGHLDEGTAKQIAAWNGLREEDFGWLVKNAGNPIANMQAIELFNRGIISQGRVEEAIREGRTKNKYIPNVLALRVKLPPVFQTVKMIATGGVTAQEGAEILKHEGYQPEVVTGLVHAATSEQATKGKALAATQVEELFEEGALTEDESIAHLKILGYTHANALLVLRVADIKRQRKLLTASLAPIRSAYIGRTINESEAGTLLDKLRVPPTQRGLLLDYWTVDRAANRKVLTPSQIVAANKNGLIPDDSAEQRLQEHGYSLEDSRILLDNEKGRTTPAP